MPENQFKTRLKIAKEKAKNKLEKKNQEPSSNIGQAFKMSTELVSAVAVGTIIAVSYTHLTLPTKRIV